MGVAPDRSVELSADDFGDLRDAWRLPPARIAQPAQELEPHLVHRLVKRRAWRNYGGAVAGLSRASRASVRRRARIAADRDRAHGPDASWGDGGSVARLPTR